MTTPYTDWLASLGTSRADMPMQTRGLELNHVIKYPGDVTDATLIGSVKVAPDSPASLANFIIAAPTFDGTNTSWVVSLSESQTASLPADGNGDGLTYLLFDFLLTLSGGSAQRLFGGLLPVSGFITESS